MRPEWETSFSSQLGQRLTSSKASHQHSKHAHILSLKNTKMEENEWNEDAFGNLLLFNMSFSRWGSWAFSIWAHITQIAVAFVASVALTSSSIPDASALQGANANAKL